MVVDKGKFFFRHDNGSHTVALPSPHQRPCTMMPADQPSWLKSSGQAGCMVRSWCLVARFSASSAMLVQVLVHTANGKPNDDVLHRISGLHSQAYSTPLHTACTRTPALEDAPA